MSQYRVGVVAVTHDSATVVGAGTAWAANLLPGQLFSLRRSGVSYQIAQVVSDVEIRLSAPYAGASQAGVEYTVTRDFTAYYNIPLLQDGDVDTAALYREAMQRIEQAIVEQDTGLTVAESRTVLTPPAPAERVNYIVPADAVGAWSGRATKIAVWADGGWKFIQPLDGWRVSVRDEGYADYIYDDGLWRVGAIGDAVLGAASSAAAAAGSASSAAAHETAAAGYAAAAGLAAADSAADRAAAAGSASSAAARETAAASYAAVAELAAADSAAARNAAQEHAGSAAGSASSAASHETAAASYAAAAGLAAADSAADRNAARDWAEKIGGPVVSSPVAEYSARHHAIAAAAKVVEAGEHVAAASSLSAAVLQMRDDAQAAAAAALTHRDVSAIKATEATNAAGSALQSAIDTLAAKADTVNARDAALGYRDGAAAYRFLAQAYASNGENIQVEPGIFSAFHWAKIAQNHAQTAATIVGGQNFGIIGDGTTSRFSSSGPGSLLNFVQGAGVALNFNPANWSITFAVDAAGIAHSALMGAGALSHEEIESLLDAFGAALEGKSDQGHTHVAADIGAATAAQGSLADTAVQPGDLAGVAISGAYADLTGRPALGSAAGLDAPSAGDAGVNEVVKGGDTRLSDARTPVAHTHTVSDVTNLQAALDGRAAADLANVSNGAFFSKANAAGVSGALSGLVAQQTGGFTLGVTQNYKLIPLSGTFTITVPVAGTLGVGTWCLTNQGAGTVTLTTGLSRSLYPGQTLFVVCDGSSIVSFVASAPAPFVAAWSPTDKSAGVTLSVSDTRATRNSPGAWAGVRSVSSVFVGFPADYDITYAITQATGGYVYVGVVAASAALDGAPSGAPSPGIIYRTIDGQKVINGVASAYGATFTTGDVIKMNVNCFNGAVTFFKNGTSQGVAGYLPPGAWFAYAVMYDLNNAVTIS